MRVLIALDLRDDDLSTAYDGEPADWQDVEASVAARLTEAGYFGVHGEPVRGSLLAVVDVTDSLPGLLASAEVGAEGHPDAATGSQVLEAVATLRGVL